MKNIYSAASLIAVALVVAASLGAIPVFAFTPPSVWVTKVMLICNGRFTTATATVWLTHNGERVGLPVTLNCSPQNHRDIKFIITEVKPNDLHKTITVRIGDGSRTCTQDDSSIPWSSWGCHFLRGGAVLVVRPTR